MNRVRWSVVVVMATLLGGVISWWRWPSSEPALPCDSSLVGLDEAGLARCHALRPLPSAQALTIGQKLDLNRCTVEALARVPGVGLMVATRIIDARSALGHFSTWDEVDAVPGVGASRLETLKQSVQLSQIDAGLW